jgi:nitroimidazol reductase NimA-like FMN-containing flavoprotein (pyridoxamine 5'-phosphate oxidase superfamily)
MDRLQPLARAECLALLGRSSIGRVAFTQRALPAIRPVSYALVGTHILLRTTSAGLGARLDGQVVAFEVDQIDEATGTGWSVVVTGTARLLREPGELVRHDAVQLAPLALDEVDAAVWITPGDMTGRRLVAVTAVAHAS